MILTSTDLTKVYNDPLLKQVRNLLRSDYGFPKGGPKKPKKFNIPALFSPESPVFPTCDGDVSEKREDATQSKLNCNSGFGSITHMTASFGLLAAAHCLRLLANQQTKTVK